MAKPVPLGLRLFLGIFILIGAIAFGGGVYNLIRSVRCAHWPVTDGVVESGHVTRHSGDAHHGDTFSAEITYQYSVAGTHFEGARLAFGAMSSSSSYAQGVVNRYPVGKTVAVHYAPDDPQNSVLETGVHGGTWVCFGVGTVFMLMGIMFLQFFNKANAARPPAPATSLPGTTQAPPWLMGVIFILMGSFALFAEPSGGTPHWVVGAAGGMFILMGLFVITLRLENKIYSNIFKWAGVLALLAIFHWVAFAPGERVGSSTTPFSHHTGVNVKTPFAIFTVLIDLAILAAAAAWLRKRGGGR